MSRFAVILAAAGKSRRFSDKNYKKPFANLAGRAVWLHSAEKFIGRDDCAQTIVVIAAEDREEFQRRFGANVAIMGIEVCEGGKERSDSVKNALALVKEDVELVAVHDAARPCLTERWIDQALAAAAKHGAALLASRVTATLKRTDADRMIQETVSRENLWQAQTPQIFRRELLAQAHAQGAGSEVTDDAQLVEQLGHPVQIVECSPLNVKITTKEDLRLAEQILKVLPRPKKGPLHPFADDDLWR